MFCPRGAIIRVLSCTWYRKSSELQRKVIYGCSIARCTKIYKRQQQKSLNKAAGFFRGCRACRDRPESATGVRSSQIQRKQSTSSVYNGRHCNGERVITVCVLVSTCNRVQPDKLEVWEWVAKRRIFDPFYEFSGLVWFVPEFSINLHIRPFRVG